jgi:hypothetical protein
MQNVLFKVKPDAVKDLKSTLADVGLKTDS